MKRVNKTVRIVIVVFWAVMMGLLFKKHVFVSVPVSLEKQYLDEYIESREEWAGIYMMDKKIGYSHSEIKRIEDGYQITEDIFMDMTIMEVPQRIETRTNSVTGRDLSLSVFSFRLRSGIISFIVYGNVEGKTLKLSIYSGGKEQKKSLELQDVPVLSNSLKYYMLKQGLFLGSKFTRTFFDPLTLSNRTILVEVEGEDEILIHGEKHKCYKIRESFKGITLYSWVDEKGDTLKEESPMGLVLVKEAKEQAIKAYWGEKPDILSATAIKVDKPFSKSGISYLKARLKNISLEGFDLHGGRQKLNGDIVEVELESIGDADSYTVPFTGRGFDVFLAPTIFIQSDNSAIKVLAKIIVGVEKDARKITRKLLRWVYTNIEKRPTLSIPSALEVLKTKQGDCNEHAVLMAALCRAVGIPAKVCAGVVYVNGSFYYHAWIEVYLDRWVSVDPTMNQFPADVTHIKFIEGDMENQFAVLKLVGKLDIEILESL
jgi:hypothetical protein